MSETAMELRVISAFSNLLGNTLLEDAPHATMEELGPPAFDDADRDFVRAIQARFPEGHIAAAFHTIGLTVMDAPLADSLVPRDAKRNPALGSTDGGDASWIVPTVQAHAPTVAIGTPLHTLQVVVQGQEPGHLQGHGSARQGHGGDLPHTRDAARTAEGVRGRSRDEARPARLCVADIRRFAAP